MSSSLIFCQCGENGNGNTGKYSKANLMNRPFIGLFAVPRVGSDGTENKVLSTDFVNGSLPASYISDKINAADPLDRWRPLFVLDNLTTERADPSQETLSDNTVRDLVQGLRSFSANVFFPSPVFLENLKKLACQDVSIILVDDCYNMWAMEDGSDLRPTLLSRFYPRLAAAVQGTSSGSILINMDFSQLEKDSKLRVIPSANTGTDLAAIARGTGGLLNVKVGEASLVSVGSFTVPLTIEDNRVGGADVAAGWLNSDFEVFNITTGLVVNIIGVVESPEGTYTFGIDIQTANDVVELRSASNSGVLVKTDFEIVPKQITLV